MSHTQFHEILYLALSTGMQVISRRFAFRMFETKETTHVGLDGERSTRGREVVGQPVDAESGGHVEREPAYQHREVLDHRLRRRKQIGRGKEKRDGHQQLVINPLRTAPTLLTTNYVAH